MKKNILIKVLACAAVLVSLTAFAGCKQKKDSSVFILGLDDSFPPMGFRDTNNEIVGYDIDLAKEVCNRLGLTFKAQPIAWDSKELELNTGKIDCIWNGLSISPERERMVLFTKPYLANAQVLVVKEDSPYLSLEDLAGKKIGLQAGSSAQDAVDANDSFKSSVKEIVEFTENVTAVNDLEMGGVDAVVMDSVVAEYNIRSSGKALRILEQGLNPELYAIAFKKNNKKLCAKVEKTLEAMAKDGTVAQISTKWFGSDISIIGK